MYILRYGYEGISKTTDLLIPSKTASAVVKPLSVFTPFYKKKT